MADLRPRVLVTGAAGNLGLRLLSQLPDFAVTGTDVARPATGALARFEFINLGVEVSCVELIQLLREVQPTAVVHLAFVIDPVRTGVLDVERMWHINVAGTARVCEAIGEVNSSGGEIRKFIYASSVSAYGPELPGEVNENYPLGGHTLPYAVHKRESDNVVQNRAGELGDCSTYILRPQIYAGKSMENYLVGAFRGTPSGRSDRAKRMRAAGRRLPVVLPLGRRYLDNAIQFIHVDDVARLIAWILRRDQQDDRLTILNVAGRGESLTFGECIRMSGNRLIQVPTKFLFNLILRLMWRSGISGIPPEASPYMTGAYAMDTARLKAFLGSDYEQVIQYTMRAAFEETCHREDSPPPPRTAPVQRPA